MSVTDNQMTKLESNNRIFAIFWILLEVFFCVMYGVYAHSTSYNIFLSGGVYQYLAAVGIALSTVIGLGGIMSFVSGLKWSGFGFAFMILAMVFQYYFLISAFWTKSDVQATTTSATGAILPLEQHGADFMMYLSEASAITNKTLGATATGAFKMALTLCIAFASVMGRAGPLQILFFVLFGGALYELNRQVITTQMYDVGGSTTIFMFGGIMGTIVSIFLSLTKQSGQIENRQNYTSSRFSMTLGLLGSAFFWVFFPTIFLDLPYLPKQKQYPFMSTNAMMVTYYAISACVVTSVALSALIHGRVRVKDLMYAPFAGAAIIATSAVHIFNPLVGILLGMIAGILQPLFNLFEQKMARGKSLFSTCVPFLFAIQGFLGALAAGIIRAIRDNTEFYDYSQYSFPFRWEAVKYFYRACFISFGIAIGAGVVVAVFVFLVSGQQQHDYYEDRAYWIVSDDGIRKRTVSGEQKSEEQIKGIHSYL